MPYSKERMEKLEQQFISEDFSDDRGFHIEKGSYPILLSAPHSVEQWRNNQEKVGEYLTGPFVMLLKEDTDCFCMYKTRNQKDDANYDEAHAYKDEMVNLVKEHNIQYVLDLHIMSDRRSHFVDIGTGKGKNINGEEEKIQRLNEILASHQVSHVKVDHVFSAAFPHTVSSTVHRETGVFGIQIEMNWRLLDSKNQAVKPNAFSLYEGLYTFIETLK
ncbi:hypothetical protein KO561_15895 [Radiobacillus kanasensis]|uniref:hypothetical protein n=1 Tax=Radiobacillus kanasensis TaxID=2844358 RepID=UPI001E62135B|nr:hypothetical protein [Radiobacillus kanasensis]UFT98662.1 hypothetical protein KO561_15895 [Radiobacillus kanasensis]